ncbi:hypothetical protein [Nonomuraea sp. 10N515B]
MLPDARSGSDPDRFIERCATSDWTPTTTSMDRESTTR